MKTTYKEEKMHIKIGILFLFCFSICFAQKKGVAGIGYVDTQKLDSLSKDIKGGEINGKRTKTEIMKTIMQNLAAIRYCYNKRLKDKPGLSGRITVKFAIISSGKVINPEIKETTMNDSIFEEQIRVKFKEITFPEFSKQNDTTEVIYPFVFSL